MSDEAKQVPLLKLMRSVSPEWREVREVGEFHSRNVPYGRMLHDAAALIERQAAEIARLEAQVKDEFNIADQERVDHYAIRQRAEAAEAEARQLREANTKLHEAYLRIRQILGAWNTPHAPTPEQVYEHTEKCANELREQLAACERDAARYRWLRDRWNDGGNDSPLEPIMHVIDDYDMDAAIDAAMSAKEDKI